MLTGVLFYSLEKAIRRYRKFAQANIDQAGICITIDQWLVLQALLNDENLTQCEIGERVFKDQASVARIIALLLKRGLITAEPRPTDGRRQQLRVTEEGKQVLTAVLPIVVNNRRRALDGLDPETVALVGELLERICVNCSPASVSQ